MITKIRSNLYALTAIVIAFSLSVFAFVGELTKPKKYYLQDLFGTSFKTKQEAINAHENDNSYTQISNGEEEIFQIKMGTTEDRILKFITETEAQVEANKLYLSSLNSYSSGYSNLTPTATGVTNTSFYNEIIKIYKNEDGSATNSLSSAQTTYYETAKKWIHSNYSGNDSTKYYTTKANAIAAYEAANGITISTRKLYYLDRDGVRVSDHTSAADAIAAWKTAQKILLKDTQVTNKTYTATEWDTDAFTDNDYVAKRNAWITANSVAAGSMHGDANYPSVAALSIAANTAVTALTCNGNAIDNQVELNAVKANINGKIDTTGAPAIQCSVVGAPDNFDDLLTYWNAIGTSNAALWNAAVTPVEADYKASANYTTDFNAWKALPAQTNRRVYNSTIYNTVALANAAVDAHVDGLAMAAFVTDADWWYLNTGFTGTKYTTRALAEAAVETAATPSEVDTFWVKGATNVIYRTSESLIATLNIDSKDVSKDAYDAGLASYAAGIEAKQAFMYSFEGENLLFDTNENLNKHLYKNIGIDGITTTRHNVYKVAFAYAKDITFSDFKLELAIQKAKDYWKDIIAKYN